jgi:hypothetical protein
MSKPSVTEEDQCQDEQAMQDDVSAPMLDGKTLCGAGNSRAAAKIQTTCAMASKTSSFGVGLWITSI